MKQLQLKPGKEGSILRKHPWIFSGALKDSQSLTPGEWVQVVSHRGELLGIGHAGDGSIAVRIIAHWDDAWLGETQDTSSAKPQLLTSLNAPIRTPDVEFWKGRLEKAWVMRRNLNYGPKTSTNAFRLVHGEGDLLPGLIIDIYGEAAIIQAHTHGMLDAVKDIAQALQQIPELELVTIYNKSASAMHLNAADVDGFELGNQPSGKAIENNLPFWVNWQTGQKTGFFLDQRENRALLRQRAAGKTVLNTFCYTGGFSIAALAGHAQHVTSVDISATAMELTNKNVELFFAENGNPNNQTHESITADVLQYLKNHLKTYDIVVLDPPAFAKSLNKKHQAVMGYKRLNALGINCVKPGGLLFTFSCSQVVDDVLFANTVTAAGIETGRNCKILYKLGQGPDHPVNLYHPEGHYLKGLVIQVD
jgi:23S rRNA (cytosine1962-C5)-methyltransferase